MKYCMVSFFNLKKQVEFFLVSKIPSATSWLRHIYSIPGVVPRFNDLQSLGDTKGTKRCGYWGMRASWHGLQKQIALCSNPRSSSNVWRQSCADTAAPDSFSMFVLLVRANITWFLAISAARSLTLRGRDFAYQESLRWSCFASNSIVIGLF